MGLEFVEMVLDLEDEFGISIADEEANKLTTVGAVIDYVRSRVKSADSGRCATSVSFYRIRRFLVEEFELKRSEVRPDSVLDQLIPIHKRRSFWKKLRNTFGGRLPRLRWPLWLSLAFRPLATNLPAGCRTVRELAYFLARTDEARLSDAEIGHKVRLIVCDNMGFSVDELTEAHRLDGRHP